MKISLISAALAVIISTTALSSCDFSGDTDRVRAIGSSAETSAEWLSDRLGDTSSTDILLATAEDAERFDIDMSTLRDEGYVIRSQGDDVLIFGKTDKGLDRGVRYYANHCVGDGALDITYGEGYRVKELTIAGHDISEYSIYLFPDADACHTFAAEELQKYIALACGTTLPIVSEKSGRVISLEQRLDDEILGEEGFTLTVDENADLHIIGGKYRGCMYGVYELLEQYIGWRFYFNWNTVDYDPNDDSIYFLFENDHVDISADLDDTQTPSFAYRQSKNFGSLAHHAKLKSNSYNHFINDPERFNCYRQCTGVGGNHGVQEPALYGKFESFVYHPETNPRQPCYTDPEFIDEAVEYFVDRTEKRIASGQRVGIDFIQVDVAQCDTFEDGFCFCKRCRNVINEEKSKTGPVLRFTNIMADAIGEKWSNLWVVMLAYTATTKPCVTPPRDNVHVSFCYYIDKDRIACGIHSLSGKDCNGAGMATNKSYAEDFEKWCEVAKRVTVWYYPNNWQFTALGFASFKNLREDIRFLYDHGIHGSWICTGDPDPKHPNMREPMDDMSLDLLYRLIWNAEMTEDEYQALIDEYLYVMYEDSAPYIAEFYEWLVRSQVDTCVPFNSHMAQTPLDYFKTDMVAADFEKLVALFEEAVRVAPSAKIEKGVIMASRTMYFRCLVATYGDLYENGTPEQKARYTELWEYFKKIALETEYSIDYFNIGALTEEDFDITKNPGEMYTKYLPPRVDDWYDWRK